MATFCAGDLFVFRVAEGEYATGRVLLDVREQCVKPRKIKAESALAFFREGVLVEVYQASVLEQKVLVSPVLVRAMFVARRLLDMGTWPVQGHEDVAPQIVEFPEFLTAHGIRTLYSRGEFQQHIEMHPDEADKIGSRGRLWSPIQLGEVFLYQKGRKDEIRAIDARGLENRNPARGDLWYSPERERVHALVGEAAREPYYELAKRHGLDLSRFYTNP